MTYRRTDRQTYRQTDIQTFLVVPQDLRNRKIIFFLLLVVILASTEDPGGLAETGDTGKLIYICNVQGRPESVFLNEE